MDVAVDEYAAGELGVGDEETGGVVSVGVDVLVGVVCAMCGTGALLTCRRFVSAGSWVVRCRR